jgi:putative oxidoreductase
LQILDRAQPLALLGLRLALGAVLFAHGQAKIFGGLAAHKHFVATIGLPAWMGYLSAGKEFIGGLLLIVGLLTRLAGLAITIEMLVAIFRVHLRHGLTGPGGYELPLLVGIVGFALILVGPGPISLDWLLSGRSSRK